MNIILFNKLKNINSLSINDDRGKHIINVLKLSEGDTFKCGVLNSHSGIGTITSIDSNNIKFSYIERNNKTILPLPLTIIVGAVRPICLKRMIRAAGECGVKRIIIAGTDLGEKSYLNSSYIKSNEIYTTLIEGTIQSGTTFVPTISFFDTLDIAISEFIVKDEINKIVFDNKIEFYQTPVSSLATSDLIYNESVVIIGSERGFTDRERTIIQNAKFSPFKLGNRILRSETAFITSLYPFIIQS